MKITGLLTELRNIAQVDRKAADAKQRSGATRSGGDVVQISDRARTLKSQQEDAAAALKQTPDLRQELVDRVKSRAAEGYYDRAEVRQAIADSLLDSGTMKDAVSQRRHATTLKAALDRTPDVRKDKVDNAKERVARGFYDAPEVRKRSADGVIEGVLGNV